MSNEFLKSAVFYEIYPNSFADANGDGFGDFAGIKSKLGYIKELGCNGIWLNPCFDSPFADGGYDIKDFFNTSPRFGTIEEIVDLLNEAHKLGIKIVLDLVPGHASEENPIFKQSGLPHRNEHSDRFVWTNSPWDMPEGYRFIAGRHQRFGSYMINFFSTQPAFNYGFKDITHPEWQMHYTHPECKKTLEYLKSIIRFWLDLGFDGFRVDMADSLIKGDDNKEATISLWQDVRKMLDAHYPNAILISEWSNTERALKAGFHCDFILDHWGNCYNALVRHEQAGKISVFEPNGKGNIMDFVTDYQNKYDKMTDEACASFITCNHDTPRLAPYYNHEQLALIYSMLFCLPGTPFLYYGDEIGMRYQKDLPSVECGFQRTGSRTPMQWTSGKNMGFSNCEASDLFLPVDESDKTICVEAQQSDPNSLLNKVKKIVNLKRTTPELRDNNYSVVYAQPNKFPFVFRRGKLVVAVNPTNKPQSAPVQVNGEVVYSLGEECKLGKSLDMPAFSFVAVREK